jgi:hypothetical protein
MVDERDEGDGERDGERDDDNADLVGRTIQLVNTHTEPHLNVNFVISNLLGEDTNVNESRLMVLEHLVQLWGASVRPNSVVTHTQVMNASMADMQLAGAADTKLSDDAPTSKLPIFYALGRFNYTDVWYVVKELQRRHKEPKIKVKFLSRLDGSKGSTLLPSPSIDWVMDITTHRPA